ncbi:MAG TPA: histidine phosphatase family protein [Acidimicrobiales bacterium]|nr:histidine phosphatase family protein [Acidimicrobiales bacterium]
MNRWSSATASRDGNTPTRRLWLIRHGESTWNASGLVQGQLDPPLSRSGREQAARCARALAAGPGPEALYASDLRRALETAAPIAETLALRVRREAALRERALGDAEGNPTSDLGPRRSGIEAGHVVDADVGPAGGESVRQLYDRAARCVARILSAHTGDVVVVCHGGVVRVLLAWLDGVTPDAMAWPEIDNGVPIVRSLPSALICA